MSIQFACSECNSRLEFVDQAAGTQRECPQCGRLIRVPEELPLVTSVPPKPAPERLPAVLEAPSKRRVRRRDDGDVEDREYREFVNKKTAAGILGILMGGLGIHKFILGFPTAGIIMLVTTVVCGITGAFCIFPIVGYIAMHVIGLVEGILYLTKTDEDFYQMYAVQKKEWF